MFPITLSFPTSHSNLQDRIVNSNFASGNTAIHLTVVSTPIPSPTLAPAPTPTNNDVADAVYVSGVLVAGSIVCRPYYVHDTLTKLSFPACDATNSHLLQHHLRTSDPTISSIFGGAHPDGNVPVPGMAYVLDDRCIFSIKKVRKIVRFSDLPSTAKSSVCVVWYHQVTLLLSGREAGNI